MPTDDGLVISLATTDPPVPSEVGGKGASLIHLRQAGMNVPGGVVLARAFFEPWLAQLRESAEWLAVLEVLRSLRTANPDAREHTELARCCERARALVAGLSLDAERRVRIDEIAANLGSGACAVRSSSPDEDLSGASFAGLYESVLGAGSASLPDAVRKCFGSCLDARVLLYKRTMGFRDLNPAIAVIVQDLVPSDVTGVTFSLNPLTNDFDEILVNASWGLGEALVSGDITPDRAVVDKVSGATLEHRAGDKGGDRPHERCLDDARLAEVADAVKRIEALYGEPVDIEWAVANGRLHILQARPITAWVPLHESLQTAPGAPRRLYADGYLTDAVTMSGATTPMTDDAFATMVRMILGWMVSSPPSELSLAAWGVHPDAGRSYVDLSMYMHLMGKGKRLARLVENMNHLMAGVLRSGALERYRPARPPSRVRALGLILRAPSLLWNMRRAVFVLVDPMFRPRRFAERYRAAVAAFEAWLAQPADESQRVAECLREGLMRVGSTAMVSSWPAWFHAYTATMRIKRLADPQSPERSAWVDALCGGYEDEMIVQMGIALYDMAMLLPASAFDDIDALEARLADRDLPDAFLARWDAFVARWGCRGPLEMEIANPKYGEAPGLALRQMAGIRAAGSEFDPREMHRRRIERRKEAYASLRETLPRRTARRLRRLYETSIRHDGAREMFKHHIMQVYERVRKLVLRRADAFVAQGRLDRREQVFELRLEDVDRAAADPRFDLRAAVAERGAFARKLKLHVRHFPLFIDSRGRIVRAPAVFEEGAVCGAAVSPGVARGSVRVLNDPFEKPVRPGDVVVAVTTDPGWTPLFVPAAAVVLEIGGELQHGALVAREYGKPCVTGIQDVMSRFEDGQVVEVDGDVGVVRFLDPDGRTGASGALGRDSLPGKSEN